MLPHNYTYSNLFFPKLILGALCCASFANATPAALAFLTDSVVDTKALFGGSTAQYGRPMNGLAFQNDILISHNGWQYTAYYDIVGTDYSVRLAKRSILGNSAGTWQTFDTGSNFVNGVAAWDAHNTISIGIAAADGTLHMSWDHHGNTLRYRRSNIGATTWNDSTWNASILNGEQNWLVNSATSVTNFSYPLFISTPDESLLFGYRIGNTSAGTNYIAKYQPATLNYATPKLVTDKTGTYNGPSYINGSTFSSTSRNAYTNGYDYGPDGKIHHTWTWRESNVASNHDICYAYSEDGGTTWKNNAGTVIGNTATNDKILVTDPGIAIASLDGKQVLINQQTQTVDDAGRVHVLMYHRREEAGYEWSSTNSTDTSNAFYNAAKTAFFHYWRNPSTGVWTHTRLPVTYACETRPDVECAANGDIYTVYNSAGKIIIAGATAASNYTDWTILANYGSNLLSEPRIDHTRLRKSGVLSVFMQENNTSTNSAVGVPLHVIDWAVNSTFDTFAGQDQKVIDYDGDGYVTVNLSGSVGTVAGVTTTSQSWTQGGNTISTSATATATVPVGTTSLYYNATGSNGVTSSDKITITAVAAGVITATASTDDGNVAANTLDSNLTTRWSGYGDGAYITWDLGGDYTVQEVNLAFYAGDQRVSYFDLQYSSDGTTWTNVMTAAQSSGTSTALENFNIADVNARYIRFVGHGNSQSLWNSITEVTFVRTIVNPDSDADGLLDSWEMQYFSNLNQTGTGDPDGDGYNNEAEETAGSNPTVAVSTPLDTDADGLPDAWELSYFSNLTATPSEDPDGDGISNLIEYQNGTNPTVAMTAQSDEDNDGLLDPWELATIGNLSQSAAQDYDNDGFSNLLEQNGGSLPNNAASTPSDMNMNGTPDIYQNVLPYTVDANTLHLWHLNEIAPPFVDAANAAHALQGAINNPVLWTPSYAGFGTGVNVNTGSGTSRGIITYAPSLSAATTADTPTTFYYHGSDGAFTVEAIVKFDSLPSSWTTNVGGQIVAFEGDGSTDRVFQFRIYNNNLEFVPIASGVAGNYSVALPSTGNNVPNTTDWFHVAVSYDGNAGVAGNLKLYFTKITSTTLQAELLGGNGTLTADFNQATQQGDFSVGNEARDTGGSSEYFRGSVDEVRISSIARTATDFIFKNPDTDGDSLPDAWEIANFSDLSQSAIQDADGDGTNNLTEFLLNLNPTLGTERFAASISKDAGSVTLSFPSATSRSFLIERSLDLQNWTTLQSLSTPSGSIQTFTDVNPPSIKAFYRVGLQE